MSQKLTIKTTLSGAGPSATSKGNDYLVDTVEAFDQVIPAGSTHEIDIAFARAKLAVCMMVPAADMTLVTNSLSTPGNTFNLKAGVGVDWSNDTTHPNPFTADPTKFFATNAGTKDARLQLAFGLNLEL